MRHLPAAAAVAAAAKKNVHVTESQIRLIHNFPFTRQHFMRDVIFLSLHSQLFECALIFIQQFNKR